MTEVKPEDYAKIKEEYKNTIKQMAKISVKDSFQSLVFANSSLNLGLQAFGVDCAREVALVMREEIDKILKATEKDDEPNKNQLTMDFYPRKGDCRDEYSFTEGYTRDN